MIKRVALVVVVLLVGVLAAVLSRPSTFHVERSLPIVAHAEIPFALVNDLHRWHFWSPWEELDPKMRRVFDGPYAGPGATYAWSSDKAGRGKLTLLEAQPYDSIHMQLELFKPLHTTHALTFTFLPAPPDGVTLRWAMDGELGFMGKAFSLFADMDTWVGKDFEKGLANLKAVSETEAKNRRERDTLLKARDEAAHAAPAPATP